MQCFANAPFVGSSEAHYHILHKQEQETFMDINHLRSVLHLSGVQLSLSLSLSLIFYYNIYFEYYSKSKFTRFLSLNNLFANWSTLYYQGIPSHKCLVRIHLGVV